MSWKGKFARKEYEGGGKRYSRMSIGGAGPSRSSGISDVTDTKGANRKWYVRDGTVVPTGSGGSEGSDDEDLYGPPKLSTTKAARKFQVGVKSVHQPPGPKKPVHEIEIDAIDKDDYEAQDTVDDVADEPAYDAPVATASGSDHEEHTEPSEALLEGLERISLSSVRLQKLRRLPFLRRNLQDGFAHRCKLAGVPTKRISLPRTSISVIYHCPLATTVLGSPRKAPPTGARSSMKDWFCPLCSLHHNFANQMMLDKHLSWDHPSVKALWGEHHNVLTLTMPPPMPEPHVRQTYQVPVQEPSEIAPDLSSNAAQVTRTKRADLDQKVFDRASAAPSSAPTESTFSTIITSNTEEDIKPKYSPSPHSSQVTDSERRSDTTSSRPPSQDPSGAKPRLSQDILGPEVTFPYLPEDNERGDVYYSCRPGGPRLYDVLNTLSLEPYGVLKWVIVDREEELFELDDVLDEDKVIQALWFRWIFLNRNRFVANYFNGTKAFVTENWQLIKKAAGLLALRTWLLVLCVNNFLLPLEVVTLMGYYQELVGVQLP
ncbi:hypothetical protein PAXINDRAFT_115917 [Paxillus involutus ATCC 200175]|uniref:Uncharacterized protein n=1 Tax=Paxillus involutus ATCC 200175 TaxID=664439 RepID=A0A0C9U5Y8_PAXIN|nr:hypothetical protein PAXINDRAFT_115917 [Paxillus involutus ATCC 200175]